MTNVTVKILPDNGRSSGGKLASAELHFNGDHPAIAALKVFTRDPRIRAWLTVHDPKALEQAEAALAVPDLFAGTKLIGFDVWERRDKSRNVTFPARQYSVNGERRAFALLRPQVNLDALEPIRQHVLAAYATYEENSPRLENVVLTGAS